MENLVQQHKLVKTPMRDFEQDINNFINLNGSNALANVQNERGFNRYLDIVIDSGKDLKDDKVAGSKMEIGFVQNMINIKPDVQKAILSAKGVFGLKNISEVSDEFIKKPNITPTSSNKSGAIVDYEVINDKGTLKAVSNIDLHAMAGVINQNGLIPVTFTATTSHAGVGAMDITALSENVISAVATDQVLTGRRRGDGGRIPITTNDDIKDAINFYIDFYNDFFEKYARTDHEATINKDGVKIPYTEFPSLESMGLGITKVDGMTVISELPNATDDQISNRNSMLRNASNAFSKELTQAAFSDNKLSNQTKFILQNMKVDMYLTRPVKDLPEMKIVQPSFKYTVTAYPDSIVKAYDSYHHDRENLGNAYNERRKFASQIHDYKRPVDYFKELKAETTREMVHSVANAMKNEYGVYPKGYDPEY